MNSLPLTEGVITRSRTYLGKEKKSTIDFFVVCERFLSFVRSLKIEDGKEHMLTKFKTGEKAVNSDHKPLVMNVLLKVPPIKRAKVEIIDFKDTNSQEKFKEITSETTNFTNCTDNLQPMQQHANKWLSTLKSYCRRAFKTIRIRNRNIKASRADCLISKRNKLLKQGNCEMTTILYAQIANIIAEESRSKALMFRKYINNIGTQPLSEMWKLKKLLFPRKKQTLLSAKINYKGKLVSEPEELKSLLSYEYGQVRLRKRPIHPLHKKIVPIRKKLLSLKLKCAMKKKTPPF